MGGSTQQTTSKNESSVTQPWAPAQPLLTDIIGKLGGMNTGVTGAQSGALANLQEGASGLPNFAPDATTAANGLLSGGNANSFAPLYQGAYNTLAANYNTLNKQLTPYASGENLDPSTNPALKSVLDTITEDTTNSVGSHFAAAGRPLGTNAAGAKALGRGLSQGLAAPLFGQYNTNVGNQLSAANSLYGAGSNLYGAGAGTAGNLAGLNQTSLGNMVQGAGLASAIPGLALASPQAQLAAANAAYSQPYGNLGMLAQLGIPIAGLGSSSTATGTGTTTQQSDPWKTAIGAGLGVAGLLGGNPFGMLGSLGSSGGLFGGNTYSGMDNLRAGGWYK